MKTNINMEDNLKSLYTSQNGTTNTMVCNLHSIANLLKHNIDNKEELERIIDDLRNSIDAISDSHEKEYNIFCMLHHFVKI